MIPIVPASGKRDAFVSGKLSFDGNIPRTDGSMSLKEALTAAHGSTQEDDPIILLDTDGFRDRYLNGEIVKEIRIRGRDLWLVTYVHDVEDVISALSGAFAGLGIPIHTMYGEGLLDEASELSEYVFPVAFIRNGTEISTGRRPDELEIMFRGKGFPMMVTIDMDRLTADRSVLDSTILES